jgi:hypothetical protein
MPKPGKRMLGRLSLLGAVFAAGCYGQSCLITSPTNGQLVQSIAPFPLTLSLTSAPSAYKADWLIDNVDVGAGFFTDTHPSIGRFNRR